MSSELDQVLVTVAAGAARPSQLSDEESIEIAKAGDDHVFAMLFERHRSAIRRHCYRLVGSLSEAEDLTQDTYLRAWRKLATFEGRASFLTWLYRIATNAALDAIDDRKRRSLPTLMVPPAPRGSDEPEAGRTDSPWIDPFPEQSFDAIAGHDTDPSSILESRQAVGLAFLCAIQCLPARQRAVLILREVLHWSALEVAELLQSTVPAVNSALQRARSAIDEVRSANHEGVDRLEPISDEVKRTLARYIVAWEAADINSLVALLKDEATFSMPPSPTWYRGTQAIRLFLETVVFGPNGCHARPGSTRVLITGASGQPALAVYQWNADEGVFRPFAIKVLAIEGSAIASVVSFTEAHLFALFGLPSALEAKSAGEQR